MGYCNAALGTLEAYFDSRYYYTMTNDYVTANIRYLVPTGSKPIYIASRGGADAALDIGADFEDHDVRIHNARLLTEPASLDREGFELHTWPSNIQDFYQIETVAPAYEAEITELVLAATGGSQALVFDHTLRSDSRGIRGERNTREPASVIHNDYTDASAAKRLRDLLPALSARKQAVVLLARSSTCRSSWSARRPASSCPCPGRRTCGASSVACSSRAA